MHSFNTTSSAPELVKLDDLVPVSRKGYPLQGPRLWTLMPGDQSIFDVFLAGLTAYLKEPKAAADIFEVVLRLPTRNRWLYHSGAHAYLAQIELGEKNHEGAIKHALAALELDPMQFSAFQLLWRTLKREGRGRLEELFRRGSVMKLDLQSYWFITQGGAWYHQARFRDDDNCYRGKSVLDVGGGTGWMGIPLIEYGAEHFTAVELSAERFELRSIKNYLKRREFGKWLRMPVCMREIAAAHAERVTLHAMDFMQFESDRKYDIITVFFVTEHLADLDGAFRQVARLLAPGGRAFVLHANFFSHGGHHQKPRDGYPELMNWGHLDTDIENPYLNRMRLPEVRETMGRYLRIDRWIDVYSRLDRGAGHLKPEILARRGEYAPEELLVEYAHVVLSGKEDAGMR